MPGFNPIVITPLHMHQEDSRPIINHIMGPDGGQILGTPLVTRKDFNDDISENILSNENYNWERSSYLGSWEVVCEDFTCVVRDEALFFMPDAVYFLLTHQNKSVQDKAHKVVETQILHTVIAVVEARGEFGLDSLCVRCGDPYEQTSHSGFYVSCQAGHNQRRIPIFRCPYFVHHCNKTACVNWSNDKINAVGSRVRAVVVDGAANACSHGWCFSSCEVNSNGTYPHQSTAGNKFCSTSCMNCRYRGVP